MLCQEFYGILVVILEVIACFAINTGCSASWSCQNGIHCRAYPVVPVHQTVQVGKPVFWICLGCFCQGLLLLGHYCLAHTSSLRLSLHDDQHCSSLPSFAMWLAFPTSDYYEGSAPYAALVASCPTPSWRAT